MSANITDIFLKNIIRSSISGSEGPTGLPTLWTTLTLSDGNTKVSYFVIKNFNPNESMLIQNGISDGTLVFDKKGNLQYRNFSFLNPAYPGNSGIDTTETLNTIKLRSNDGLYNPQTNIVTNGNMQYILYKNKDNYQLLYNPIHGPNFGNLYRNISVDNLSYGTETGPPELNTLFMNYCNSINDNNNGYADPTCQCFMNTKQNELNAIYGGNMVNYPGGLPSNTGAYTFLTGTPKNHQAVCGAPGCRYSGIQDSSFLSKFVSNNIGKTDCGDKDYEYIPFCSDYLNATGNLNVKDKSFYDRCAKIISGIQINYKCDTSNPENPMCVQDNSGKYINAENCLASCNSQTGSTVNNFYCTGEPNYQCLKIQPGQIGDYSSEQECKDNCKKPTIKTWYYDTSKNKCIQDIDKTDVIKYFTIDDCINAEMPYICDSKNSRCVKYNDGTGQQTLANCKNSCGIQYKCGNNCEKVQDGSGYLTKDDCINKEVCTNNNSWSCRPGSNGYNTCQNIGKGGQYPTLEICNSYCNFFKCSPYGQEQCKTPVFDGTAKFSEQADCKNTCSKFSCVDNVCTQVDDGTGEYESIEQCRNECTPYKCNTSTGICEKATDGTGQYKYINQCQEAGCKISNSAFPLIIGLSIFAVLIIIGIIIYFYMIRK